MRFHCYGCCAPVSSEVPDDAVLRGISWCPECIEKGRDLENGPNTDRGYLGKALVDNFEYAVALRDGWVIFCSELEKIGQKYYLATGIARITYGAEQISDNENCFPRGVTFLREDVVWVADAPRGS